MAKPIMIHGDNFAFITAIEKERVFWLGNWWYITSENCMHRVHFLTHDLKALCGAELRGNHLIPDTSTATKDMSFWKGSRCERCTKILESRKQEAEREALKILRETGLHIQLTDIDYLEDDGYLPIYVAVYAPVRGLAREE